MKSGHLAFENNFFEKILKQHLFSVCVYMYVHSIASMWRPENNLRESVPSFYVDPRIKLRSLGMAAPALVY